MLHNKILSIIIFLIIIFLSGCIEEEKPIEEKTENYIDLTFNDNGKNVTVEPEDKINITLEQNSASTGYSWNIVEINDDILKLESNQIWGETNLIGSTIYETWIFKILKNGSTDIKLSYYRPWENISNATKNFTMHLTVKEKTDEPKSETSSLQIKIGDKPIDDFKHVNITFSEIKIHSNLTGWENINIYKKTADLLYLHNQNLNESLCVKKINPGNYSKIWIKVDNATGIIKSTNEQINFDIPSGILKIHQPFKIISGNNTIIFDIDLENSIITTKNKYKILPVISSIRHIHENQIKFHENEIQVEQSGKRSDDLIVFINENITFTATSKEIKNKDLSYLWDFGDGTNSTKNEVNHSYNNSGRYWIQLTTTDDKESVTYIHVLVKEQKKK